MKKRLLCFALIAALLFALPACGKSDSKQTGGDAHTKVRFTMENGDSFTVELYPEYAPATVENFIGLVKEGYYNGLTFHRVIEGFMAQGGEGPARPSIKGEFAANGFTQNTLKHERGVISMARTQVMDSASTQFFICYDTAASLDGNYAAFGKVIEGMETVDDFLKIERVYNGERKPSKPVTPIVIKTAEVIA
ncbi:MAG: peptidylprolyl isomerase [Clostridia bacterium]|nr:peptidylprolyl isomerase [Clostridia bacterium]